jgi:MFS transporter, ACS family, hexuronate transporter
MAACSWLAFFHRQILSVLAPTILAETHLDAREFAGISSYFFVAYFIANPLWGSILDYIGLRIGMLIGVGVWSLASVSHGWMSTFLGFAVARVALGLGEGVTFPGGLRTAVESLPASRRARAIALSFSGGTLGGAAASYIAIPLGLRYGWRAAFVITGAFGIAWLALWAFVSRPPFLPKHEKKSTKPVLPNLSERRLWALVFSYALPAIAPGPILTLLALYFESRTRRVAGRFTNALVDAAVSLNIALHPNFAENKRLSNRCNLLISNGKALSLNENRSKLDIYSRLT